MYKLISVCLTLTMVFGDISSVKHHNADQAELKKAKTSSDPNIQLLEVSKQEKQKESKKQIHSANKIQKQKKPDRKKTIGDLKSK